MHLLNSKQEEEDFSEDKSQSYSSKFSGKISYIPYLPDKFKGRHAAFDWIKARLGINDQENFSVPQHPLSVVRGWPGIGKSAFFAKLAHDREVQQAFRDGIFFVALGPNPEPVLLLAPWWKRLGLDLSKYDQPQEIAACLRGALSGSNILILIDDVWSAADATFFQVGGSQAATIISTRSQLVAADLTSGRDIYKLPVLSEDEAFELFTAWAPQVAQDYRAQCITMIETIERLPLGVKAAARMLDREAANYADVEQLLYELNDGLAVLRLKDPDYLASAEQGETGVVIPPTLDYIFSKSTSRLPLQLQEAFACLALFNFKPAVFELNWIAQIWRDECNIKNPKVVITELVNRGLVERSSAQVFQTHALMYYHAVSLFNTKFKKLS